MSKCSQWLSNPGVNPSTGRKIKINGPTYKKLQIECNGSCPEWLRNPLKNPETGRKIKREGPTFRIFKQKCSRSLEKFIIAQDTNQSYDKALQELKRGKKTGHWIWYIFPQISGLGFSKISQYYALSSVDEAIDYLQHPILGKRYFDCLQVLVSLRNKTIDDIFSVDSMKVHSSLTLFYLADPENELIHRVLNKYFKGKLDIATESLV
jgi:uncharacterized protein (DUF1810 family)